MDRTMSGNQIAQEGPFFSTADDLGPAYGASEPQLFEQAFAPPTGDAERPRGASFVSGTGSRVIEKVNAGLATTKETVDYLHRQLEDADGRQVYARMTVARIIVSQWFEWSLGILVLSQLALAAVETDYGAKQEDLPAWCMLLHYLFVLIYTVEIGIRIFVWRRHYFKNNGNLFDVAVVSIDVLAIIAEQSVGDFFPPVAFLRCLRMLKLARTARVLKQFRELYVIVYSLAGVLKSIFWESMVLFVVLTIASIVAVEYIHPINAELAETGIYEGCPRCARAFQSVMQSNLTFFQGMVAGDSWGLVIVPIIEHRPDTALFFIMLTLLVVLGLMNLILSAIVDKASEVRHIVEATALLEKRAVVDQAKVKLVSVCEELDEDMDGNITADELDRALQLPAFDDAMQSLDLGREDLDTLFGLMDVDNNRRVSYSELADTLQKLKSQDSHMLLILIERSMKACYRKISDQLDEHHVLITAMAEQREMLKRIGWFEEEIAETLEEATGARPHQGRREHSFNRLPDETIGDKGDPIGHRDDDAFPTRGCWLHAGVATDRVSPVVQTNGDPHPGSGLIADRNATPRCASSAGVGTVAAALEGKPHGSGTADVQDVVRPSCRHGAVGSAPLALIPDQGKDAGERKRSTQQVCL